MPHCLRAFRGRGVALLIGLMGSAAAAAPSQAKSPPLRPSVDVVVVYSVTSPTAQDHPSKVRITYANHAQRVRIDDFASLLARDPSGSVIFDRTRGEVITLVPDRKAYLTRGIDHLANPGILLNAAMRFTRAGEKTIAALPCTDWNVTSGTFHGSACVTSAGVVLQAQRVTPQPETLEARSVHFGPPPAGAFDVPADYLHIDRFGRLIP